MIPSYLKDSQCAIIVFDLGNRQSFESVESWLTLYKENRTQFPLAVLAGNKSDLPDRFKTHNIEQSNFNKLIKEQNN